MNIAPKETALRRLQDFINAAILLSKDWDSVLDTGDTYPLTESFDEWIGKLFTWLDDAKANRKARGL